MLAPPQSSVWFWKAPIKVAVAISVPFGAAAGSAYVAVIAAVGRNSLMPLVAPQRPPSVGRPSDGVVHARLVVTLFVFPSGNVVAKVLATQPAGWLAPEQKRLSAVVFAVPNVALVKAHSMTLD